MSRLFSMELYKMTRKKSIFICFLLAIFSGFILSVSSGLFSETTAIRGNQWFLVAAKDISYFMFIFAMIVPAILFTTEFSENTMKNLLMNGVNRKKLFISKILVISITIGILNFIIPLVGTLLMTITKGWGGDYPFQSTVNVMFMLFRMTLVMIAYASIFTFIGLLMRNIIGAIAFSYSVRLIEVFLLLMSNHFLWLSWLKKIVLAGMDAYYLSPVIERTMLITGTALSLGIILSVCLLGAAIFERQDIRT